MCNIISTLWKSFFPISLIILKRYHYKMTKWWDDVGYIQQCTTWKSIHIICHLALKAFPFPTDGLVSVRRYSDLCTLCGCTNYGFSKRKQNPTQIRTFIREDNVLMLPFKTRLLCFFILHVTTNAANNIIPIISRVILSI